MRVLVLYCHPLDDSFNAAVHRAAVETLRAAGHEVDDCDLYAEGFDPVLRRDEQGRRVVGAVLQARDKHGLPALAPLVYTSCMVIGGLVGQSAEGFAWGVVVGSALGPFLLPLIGAWRAGLRWRPSILTDWMPVWNSSGRRPRVLRLVGSSSA